MAFLNLNPTNDFPSPEKQKDLRNMLRELLDLDEGLSKWEMDFIDSLNNWEGNFTFKQADKLEEVRGRHF